MKAAFWIMLSLGVCLGGAPAFGTSYQFNPQSDNLQGMPHQNYFVWGIDLTLPSDEEIVSASLHFDKLYDWTYESNALYLHLLDSAPVTYKGNGSIKKDVTAGDDSDVLSDQFAGASGQTYLTTYSDPYGDWSHRTDFPWTFTGSQLDALRQYAADGNFGIGLDPDCHFYDCGVRLDIETTNHVVGVSAVPEPMTLTGAVLGLCMATGYVRRRLGKARRA